MNRIRTRNGRRAAAFVGAGLIVGLPLAALIAAPTARADDSPAANLAGLNANAYSTAMQFIPLVKGLVPAGNLSTGDFFQVSVPYSASSSQTGPASTGTAAPAYPGPVATALPGALQTFGFPAAFAELTAYPAIAESAYPSAPGRGATGDYSPPAGSTAGVGQGQTTSAEGGSTAQSNTSETSFAAGEITIGSSSTKTSTNIGASSVADTAHADVSHVSILKGLVDIASIASDASSASDGNQGTENSALKVGSVTVAGEQAYIGSDGLHLASTVNNLGLTDVFNSALAALQQAGISVKTIAPNSTVDGPAASVDSGAVQIQFVDPNIPNPQGDVPVSSVGTDVDLALTHADAQATVFPPLPPITSSVSIPTGLPPSGSVNPGSSYVPPAAASGGNQTIIQTTNQNTPSGGAGGFSQSGSPYVTNPPSAQQPALRPASFVGMPTRTAWVILSILISLVASGPLLAYANWQLLRGRTA
jgi:hypothetical protein